MDKIENQKSDASNASTEKRTVVSSENVKEIVDTCITTSTTVLQIKDNGPRLVDIGVCSTLCGDKESSPLLSSDDSVCSNMCLSKIPASQKSGCTEINAAVNNLSLSLDTGKFVKLTSFERRRFERARKDGKTREEALEIAREALLARRKEEPSVTTSRPTIAVCKRQRSDDSPQEAVTKKAKPVYSTGQKVAYNTIAGSVRIGLLPRDIDNSPLKSEQMVQIQNAIIDLSIEQKNSGTRPQFLNCQFKTGWLLFTCFNEATAEWLRLNCGHIEGKCKIGLKVAKEEEFPKPHIIRGYFPQSIDVGTEKILETIETQNADLPTSTWRVLQRTTENSLVHLVMAIGDSTLNRLRAIEGKIFYRFGVVHLVVSRGEKSTKTRPKVSNVTPSTPAEDPRLNAERPCCSKDAIIQPRKSPPRIEAKKSSSVGTRKPPGYSRKAEATKISGNLRQARQKVASAARSKKRK